MSMPPRLETLPAVSIASSKSSTVLWIGCTLSGWGRRIARRSAAREVAGDPVGVTSMKSMGTRASMGSVALTCEAKAVLLVRRGPTCRRRCAR